MHLCYITICVEIFKQRSTNIVSSSTMHKNILIPNQLLRKLKYIYCAQLCKKIIYKKYIKIMSKKDGLELVKVFFTCTLID